MLVRIALIALYMLVAIAVSPLAFARDTNNDRHYTYILVHGATGGGWDWKTIQQLLVEDGHVAYRPTLTGLGEKVHLASPEINLTTHINDIVNIIIFENLDDVVLVGHSYGGMVITGVMDRIPERVGHAIFLDAAMPGDGMSMLDTSGRQRSELNVVDGQIHFPWIDFDKPYPRDVPQPLKTFTEPVSFKNAQAKALPATYVACVSPDRVNERRANDPSWKQAANRGWEILTLDSGHNAQRTHPDELAKLLITIPEL